MIISDVLLATSVFSTGLFTGLLMTVLFFFQRALRELTARCVKVEPRGYFRT
jgi:hypothetical protein